VLVLPAFGEFTGGALVQAGAGEALYLVAGPQVLAQPRKPGR
jgi:metallophosphoesterase superfamily enzyme